MVKLFHDYPKNVTVKLLHRNSILCMKNFNQQDFTKYRYKMALFFHFFKLFRVIFFVFLVGYCYIDGFRGFWHQINLYFLLRHSFWNFLFALNVYTTSSCAVVIIQILNTVIFYLLMSYNRFNADLGSFIWQTTTNYGMSYLDP